MPVRPRRRQHRLALSLGDFVDLTIGPTDDSAVPFDRLHAIYHEWGLCSTQTAGRLRSSRRRRRSPGDRGRQARLSGAADGSARWMTTSWFGRP